MGKKKEIVTKDSEASDLDEQSKKDAEPQQTASMSSYLVCHAFEIADALLTCSHIEALFLCHRKRPYCSCIGTAMLNCIWCGMLILTVWNMYIKV